MTSPEQLGKVVEWNDDRGFGFIQPLAPPGERLFLHVRDYRQDGRRPQAGELVKYRRERQADGRWKASRVHRATAPASRARPSPPRRTAWRIPAAFQWLLVAAYAALLAWAIEHGRLPLELALGLLLLSAATWVAYALDKDAATRGRWRISEGSLHLMELLGGWPGALAAQQLLRHKTRKPRYRLAFWSMTLAHIAAMLVWVFWSH